MTEIAWLYIFATHGKHSVTAEIYLPVVMKYLVLEAWRHGGVLAEQVTELL